MPYGTASWRREELTERCYPRLTEDEPSQQLDLFSDNRRTIWLNQAHEALRRLDLAGAMAGYAKIIDARLDDERIRQEQELSWGWHDRLARYGESSRDAEEIHRLHAELEERLPSPLRTALLEFMVAQLLEVDAPELFYPSPRFHPGLLCHELREYDAAATWFSRGIEAGVRPLGRFLAYQGDALFRLGNEVTARELYREAFLREPLTIDLPHLEDLAILELIDEVENEEEAPVEELLPWLPVWGWLTDLFTLELPPPLSDQTGFHVRPAGEGRTAPLTPSREWFDSLCSAEFLRASSGDGQELIRVRRRLKELHGGLFRRYMKKMGG